MGNQSRRVRAIGGIFFRSPEPARTRQWYQEHLGLNTDSTGTNFSWRHANEPDRPGYTQWAPFSADTRYFGSENQQFMVNYRVDDLESLLNELETNGVTVVGEIHREPYGLFAHIIDCDGMRVELWEPVDKEYEKMLEGVTD